VTAKVPPQQSDTETDGQAAERIAKTLARAGVASRREVERYIEAGRVAINGVVVESPATRLAPGDIVTVDGEVVDEAEPTRVFRYHKPVGLVTTHADPKGRPTVFQALPDELPRVISVGRLDLNSEGLLLLTNDGGLSRALELPNNAWIRVYRARAFGEASQAKLDTLKQGITIEGVRYGPVEAKLDKATGRNCWITVSLAEGKNREVRRVLEAVGLKVNRLIRLAYGPFVLGTLGAGEVEEVGPRVIRELLTGLVSPTNMPKGSAVQFKPSAVPAPRLRRQAVTKTAEARTASDPRPKTPLARGRTSDPTSSGRPDKPVRKAGWAKAKPRPPAAIAAKKASMAKAAKRAEFPPPDAPRRAGRAGPKATSTPPGRSDARPPSPRPGGGPKRRG
jgi:23S rRNA pseudouridine2605 synthase